MTEVEVASHELAGDHRARSVLVASTAVDGDQGFRYSVVQPDAIPGCGVDYQASHICQLQSYLPQVVAAGIPHSQFVQDVLRDIQVVEETGDWVSVMIGAAPILIHDPDPVGHFRRRIKAADLVHPDAVSVAHVWWRVDGHESAKRALPHMRAPRIGIGAPLRQLGQWLCHAIADRIDVGNPDATQNADLCLWSTVGLTRLDLHVGVQSVTPIGELVRVGGGGWDAPGQDGAHTSDLGFLAASTVRIQVDRQYGRVVKAVWGYAPDVVDIDLHGSQAGPLASVVPVRPERNVLLAARATQVA